MKIFIDTSQPWKPARALAHPWPFAVFSRKETASGIVAVGLVIRLLCLVSIARQPLAGDAASYNTVALVMIRGGALNLFWPPGVPLFLVLVHRICGDGDLIARLAMLTFYLLCSFALYELAVLVTGERISGNISLALLALSPASIIASLETMTELPAAMCLVIIAYGLLRESQNAAAPWANSLMLGFAIGYLSLVRPSSLILLALVPLYIGWRAHSLRAPLTVVVAGALVIGLWMGYAHEKTGFYRINTSSAKNFYYGNNPKTPIYKTWWFGSHHELANTAIPPSTASEAVAQEKQYSALAIAHIRLHPGLFLVRTFNRVCVYFAFNTFSGSFLIEQYGISKSLGLLILGFDAAIYLITAVGAILYICTLSFTDPRLRSVCVLICLALLYAFPYFIAFSHPRLHYPTEPILDVLFAGLVASYMGQGRQNIRQTLFQRRTPAVAALIVFALVQLEFLLVMAQPV